MHIDVQTPRPSTCHCNIGMTRHSLTVSMSGSSVTGRFMNSLQYTYCTAVYLYTCVHACMNHMVTLMISFVYRGDIFLSTLVSEPHAVSSTYRRRRCESTQCHIHSRITPTVGSDNCTLNLHSHTNRRFTYLCILVKSITVAVFVGWWCGGGAVTSTMIMTWMAEDVVVPVTVGVLNFNRFRAT